MVSIIIALLFFSYWSIFRIHFSAISLKLLDISEIIFTIRVMAYWLRQWISYPGVLLQNS